jgi:hypothetical protein
MVCLCFQYEGVSRMQTSLRRYADPLSSMGGFSPVAMGFLCIDNRFPYVCDAGVTAIAWSAVASR